ncbi:MAG: nodulation protein NfeD [Pontiellaceae bacterium]|nr:nodulation protein NfeD [Pontiellaceae bacterium]
MIKKLLFTLLAGLTLLPCALAEKKADDRPLVYVIPVKEEIGNTTLYIVRRGVDEAVRKNADAIIFDMDTPGGGLDATIKILKTISKTDIPTYTFVNNNAYSAGAIIAMGTKHIYMAPGSEIGAATPLSMGPTGIQELPDEIQEKMTSAVAAKIRSTAEQNGHDPQVANAMVRAEAEYIIDGTVISEKGQLLTLTNGEASILVGEDQKPLLSEGTVNNIDELLQTIGLENAETITIEITMAEHVARWIESISLLLLIVGVGGIWMEIKTPGFGIFGIAGITSLALFFIGHHIAGLAGYEDILLFVIGVILLILEVFVTPGFGVLGISGLLLMVVSLVSAMSEHMPGKWRPISYSAETFTGPLLKVTLAFVGSIALIVLTAKFLPKTHLFKKIALDVMSPSPEKHLELVGLEGIAHSDLRPGGTAYFGDRKMDVITRGDYIPSQTPVRIAEAHGNRIVVESIS